MYRLNSHFLVSVLLVVFAGCSGNGDSEKHSSTTSPVVVDQNVTNHSSRPAGSVDPLAIDPQDSLGKSAARPVEAVRPVVDSFGPRFLRPPRILPNPNRNAPLVAIVEFETSEPVLADLLIRDEKHQWTIPSHTGMLFSQQHRITAMGFRPDREHRLQIRLRNPKGEAVIMPEELAFHTSPLPADFPPLQVTVSQPDRMEPGITLFNAMQWVRDSVNESLGLIVAVDSAGEVVWYCRTDHPVSELRRLRNGNFVYLRNHRSQPLTAAIEIDILGNVVNQWYAAGINSQVPPGSIPVDVDSFHHEIYELKSGNLLAIGTEVRILERYPTSETKRSTLKPAHVVGDVIVEFRRDGSIVKKWKMHDLMDTLRIGYGSLGNFWDTRIYRGIEGGTKDWSHANAVVCNESEEWMLVSLRHQDALVKIHRETNKIAWILSVPSGWRSEWRKYLLKPKGKLNWPYHQHAPMITPQNTMLMYDNGNYRARPFRRKRAGHQNYSRVVEFAVDEKNMTVEQVWEYRGEQKETFYSPLFGDADWMPNTGNVLITDGGRMFDEKDRPSDAIPGSHQWARILEVTHTTPAEKVFEIVLNSGKESNIGWSIYRSERLPSLLPVNSD